MSVNGLGGGANFPAMKGLDSLLMKPIEKNVAEMVQATVTAVVGHAVLSAFEQAFNQLGDQLGSILGGHTPQCQPPNPADSAPPAGQSGLSVGKDGVITTPGGYKIDASNQFEWKITNPDGKTSTRIWGDPHVDESDGGKWDFKRDSTFMLPDGTRINCATQPYGNGMTVTSGLEIIAGNERVQVTDIAKGKGKVGDVTHDGFAHANSFGGKDVFVMGGDGNDWTFQGKEITGSNNGGESFKLGKDMKPLVDTTTKFGGPEQWVNQIVEQLMKQIETMFNQAPQRPPPFVPPFMGGSQGPRFPGCWNPGDYKTGMGNTFKDVDNMFKQMQDMLSLADSLNRRMTMTFSA